MTKITESDERIFRLQHPYIRYYFNSFSNFLPRIKTVDDHLKKMPVPQINIFFVSNEIVNNIVG